MNEDRLVFHTRRGITTYVDEKKPKETKKEQKVEVNHADVGQKNATIGQGRD